MTAYGPAEIARVCHEANRALQLIQADPAVAVAPTWDACSPEMRTSVVEGVHGVLAGATPEQSHSAWCEFKRKHGWTWGPVKDEAAKTHPCLVPYAELPESQQVKDHLFAAIVTALGKRHG